MGKRLLVGAGRLGTETETRPHAGCLSCSGWLASHTHGHLDLTRLGMWLVGLAAKGHNMRLCRPLHPYTSYLSASMHCSLFPPLAHSLYLLLQLSYTCWAAATTCFRSLSTFFCLLFPFHDDDDDDDDGQQVGFYEDDIETDRIREVERMTMINNVCLFAKYHYTCIERKPVVIFFHGDKRYFLDPLNTNCWKSTSRPP